MTPADPLDFLLSMDTAALLVTFSFSLILDIPRYTFGFLAVLMVELGGRRGGNTRLRLPSISVIIAGHNEAASIRRCVLSLREQTVRAMEIICVDDGSTDGMSDELYRLRAEGLIDTALVCRIRCGKSSAANFAMSRAYGEVMSVLRDIPQCVGFHLCGAYLCNRVRRSGLRDEQDRIDTESVNGIRAVNEKMARWVRLALTD